VTSCGVTYSQEACPREILRHLLATRTGQWQLNASWSKKEGRHRNSSLHIRRCGGNETKFRQGVRHHGDKKIPTIVEKVRIADQELAN
jgi:hypothetical protein